MIKIDDNKRQQIEGFLPGFRQAIKTLSEVHGTLKQINERGQKNEAQLAELEGVATIPTNKQLLDRLICQEGERVYRVLGQKAEKIVSDAKHVLVAQIHVGGELFRAAAATQLLAAAEDELRASLPASVLADTHLTHRLLGESASKRSVGRFLNSFAATQRDDAEAVISEANRLAKLLDDLLEGRDIAVPGNEAPASA